MDETKPPGPSKQPLGAARIKFTQEEDELLRELVKKHGDKAWKTIAKEMKTRTTRQCRERFKNYLAPEIHNGPWTNEDDNLLLQKFKEFGPKWKQIAVFFNSRSDVNVKNRHALLVSKGYTLMRFMAPMPKQPAKEVPSVVDDAKLWPTQDFYSEDSEFYEDKQEDSGINELGGFGW